MTTASVKSLPEAPESRALQKEDKALLDGLFRARPPKISEFSFTNLFAWRLTHPVLLSRVDDTLLMWRGQPGQGELLEPVGQLDKNGIKKAFAWSNCLGGENAFTKVSLESAQELASAWPELQMTEDRDNADYLYRSADLIELEGRNYDGKRNLIKKFKAEVDARYLPMTSDLIAKCKALQDCWCEVRECSIHADLSAEDMAANVILDDWEVFNISGGVLLNDDKVIAFAVGEALSPGTAVVHVEKADPKFPGIYQTINQCFAADALRGFEFVNREQDLGVPGLRKAKLSYHPVDLVMKYTVELRNNN
jgi:uncharacterized protein